MSRIGFYPGSFDPVTYGHLDIIARSARLVDKLVLGVGTHHGKKALLDAAARIKMLEDVTKPIAEHTGLKIIVVTFDDLAVSAARRHHAGLIIRAVPQALREETKNSAQAGLFYDVPEGMHHPPNGFVHAGSWKTPDQYGNLQLTFFSNGADWVADVDIDDAGGLAHVFQVLRNELTQTPTHPYNIHEILIKYQMLDPAYELEV